jgi:hypothetical protein
VRLCGRGPDVHLARWLAWGEPWVQLMGDSPEDWRQLEALAAAGIRTCGPATALIELRRRAILREWSAPPVPR